MAMSDSSRHLGCNVRGDLIPEKVEVYPGFGTSPLGTTEQFAIEPASGRDVDNRKGVMERFRHGKPP
jgi:hypothetical protein